MYGLVYSQFGDALLTHVRQVYLYATCFARSDPGIFVRR